MAGQVYRRRMRIRAGAFLRSDLRGIGSHGAVRLRMARRPDSAGDARSGHVPEIVRHGPTTAVIGGHRGMGHALGVRPMILVIGKAKRCSLGAVAARNLSHFGIPGYYPPTAHRRTRSVHPCSMLRRPPSRGVTRGPVPCRKTDTRQPERQDAQRARGGPERPQGVRAGYRRGDPISLLAGGRLPQGLDKLRAERRATRTAARAPLLPRSGCRGVRGTVRVPVERTLHADLVAVRAVLKIENPVLPF